MYSNKQIAFDILISVFIVFNLSTTILSISTTNWNIDSNLNRTGLFQKCSTSCCCKFEELNRTVTLLICFVIILLLTSTLLSFFLMGTSSDDRNLYYLLVPVGLFGAGISMTLTFIKISDQIYVNGYSAFIFLIDIVLAYILGGITVLHGSIFYY